MPDELKKKEISCRITNTFLGYVNKTRPELLEPLLEGLPFDYDYLVNTDNWITWDLERVIEERLVSLYADDMVMFKVGRSIASNRSLGVIGILFNLCTSPESLYRYTQKISGYFTKGLIEVRILDSSKQSATVELKIKGRQTRGACLFNQGMYSAVTELFGLEPAHVEEVSCVVPPDEIGLNARGIGSSNVLFGAECCVFRLKWKSTGWSISKLVGMSRKQALDEAMGQLEENYLKLQNSYDKLSASEGRYRLLLENASDIVIFLDRDGVITSINRRGIELSGYSMDEVVGKNFLDFLPEDSRGEAIKRFREGLEGSTEVFESALRGRSGFLTFSMNSSPIVQDAAVLGIMVIARDITKEREVAARLVQAESFAAKGVVAADIAHEINNSLANIETAMFVSSNMHIEEQHRRDVTKDVRDEIERMSAIVKSILEVYSSEDTPMEHMDINREVGKVMDFTVRRLKGKGIRVLTRLDSVQTRVFSSPGNVKQILLNLVRNAEDALEDSTMKSITVSTEDSGQSVLMRVKDTGRGMSGEAIDRVRSRFFTTMKDSAGLGLVVCWQLVERIGGSMEIKSRRGEGTTVTVSFRKHADA